MKTIAVIAEYNPFHNGHAYLMEEARRMTGADRVTVIMSGDFVQRGEPAVCDKYLRTRMALECGADAVFELPAAYACGSAENFAEAGVKLAYTLGCIDYLAFGSESGDIGALMDAAVILVNEPGSFKEVLSDGLKKGLSYPAAREAAFRAALEEDKSLGFKSPAGTDASFPPDRDRSSLADLLKDPNNILALEYCKAIIRLRSLNNVHPDRIPEPITIKRIGSGYSDSSLSATGFSSATAIRKALSDTPELRTCPCHTGENPEGSLLSADSPEVPDSFRFTGSLGVPDSVQSLINGAYHRSLPITADSLSDMLFVRLATMTGSELSSIEGMTPDLLNAVQKIKHEPASFTETVGKLKSKNNTYSSISRLLLHTVLGVDTSFTASLKASSELPYARLLGLRTASSELLRPVSDLLGTRLITKLADADRTDPLLALDIRAAYIYGQLVKTSFGTCPTDEFCSNTVRI